MRFHWQNLNDSRRPKRHLHGRCWLHFGKRCLAIEWLAPAIKCGITIQRRAFHLQVPLLGNVYISDGGDWGEKELSLSVHRDCVRWNLWTPTMEWDSTTPFWRRGCFFFIDYLLGSHKYATSEAEVREVLVPMPERSCRGRAVLHLATWKRPRWPFTKRLLRVHIDMDKGEQIPVMGKGENSWDCGEDAIYGTTTQADTIEAGVAALVESALTTRRKYGVPPSVLAASEQAGEVG